MTASTRRWIRRPVAALTLCQLRQYRQLRRAHPAMTVTGLIEELLRQGVLSAGTFSEGTI